MISLNEQGAGFGEINRELQLKSGELVAKLKEAGHQFQTKTNIELRQLGLVSEALYYLKSGNLGVEHDGRELYLLETGDVFVYLQAENYETSELNYSTKYEAEVEVIPLETIYNHLTSDKNLFSLLLTVKTLSQLQLMQIIGTLTDEEQRAAPGFKRYFDGDIIIKEGDDADYVYSLTEGVAEVTLNGVRVGEIVNDEIFGAIAVLTDQKRTATVTAKTSCTVLLVHKDEFQKMAHSHPHIFISVLKSLASNIVALNEKVTSLTSDELS